jgi:hypothetical protein
MQRIIPRLSKELEKHVADREVWRASPYKVTNYRELVEHTARLSYANRNHLIFFRGQSIDFQSKAGGSTLYPAIYRGENLTLAELEFRLKFLDSACTELLRLSEQQHVEGWRDIAKKKYVQWSILQHYEVAATPLIDVTHSLRVACSFAQLSNEGDFGFVYALGLPYPTNRISINSEEDIVNIRLLSICPPQALRPYFQEGYMAGTPDVTSNYDSKTELDFRNRLIAKFEIPTGGSFWGRSFSALPKTALYPARDKIRVLCEQIADRADKQELSSGEVGNLIVEWARVEEAIKARAAKITTRILPVRDAIEVLHHKGAISSSIVQSLNAVRTVRNLAAHHPDRTDPSQIGKALGQLRSLAKALDSELRKWDHKIAP